GAQFEIVSELKENPMHMGLFDLDDIHKLDDNGKMGALVIVNCGLEDVFFQNIYGKIYQTGSSGQYRIVLRERTQYFVIQKKGFADHKYFFPKPLKSGTVYEMTVDEKGGGPKNISLDLNTITFKFNTENVMVSYDNNAPFQARSNYAQYKLPKSEYQFKFAKEGYETLTKTVDISKEDQNLDINLKAGSSDEKFSPPGLVIIESQPEEAIINLNGLRVGLTPYQGSHFPGEYTITIEKDLFYSETATFTLSSNETLRLPKYELTPKYGLISINSNPQGAKAILNDRVLGQTPLTKTRIESGQHNLSLELDTYQKLTKDFEIQDGDELEFTEELTPNFSDVTIKCLSTENAILSLNGKEIGKLPYYNPKLIAGNYSLKISKDLWLPLEEQLLIPPNEKITKEYVLTQNFGTLKITAPKADIYLNQVKIASDYVETNRKPGNYQITAKRDRHLDAGKEINLISGTEEIINLEPQARLGSISLLTVDKYNNNRAVNDANIYLDNNLEENKSPALLSLLYGDYDIKVTHPHFLDYQGKLTVTENKHQEITIPLETYAGSKKYHYDKHKKRAWISTGVTTLILGGAISSNIIANSYYDQYEKTTSPADALDYKDQTQTWRDIRDYTYYTASGVAIYSLYSWIRTALAKD
nr:PEGA domain-containing protein [bacterium]